MNTDIWLIVADDEPIEALVAAARSVGGAVTALVAGTRARADAAALAGPDRVCWVAVAEDVPEEAAAAAIAARATIASPRLLLAHDVPAARVILAAAAAAIGARMAAGVISIALDGEAVTITRSVVDGQVLETLTSSGSTAAILDASPAAGVGRASAAPIEILDATRPAAMRIVEAILDSGASTGLKTAARVIGIGLGVRSKADLAIVEDLASAAGAEVACTLPVCDDMRWYDAGHVLGRSHLQVKPDLYVAVGISGQPQHMFGIRDAKVVVAINSDPAAPILRACDYAVVGDLYKVVPALAAALR